VLKRVFDIISSGIALIALPPVFLVIAILIKLDSRGPVFYRQARMGVGSRVFQILKFRTMMDGADRKGLAISLGGDPRITRVGKILRRCELDELPTLVNVLKGDMSIVGPRPETPKYLPYYTEEQKRIFSVRPGITDLGTLKFRDEGQQLARSSDPESYYVETILPEKLRLGLEYVDRRSFLFDLRIILHTLGRILIQSK
jgi:lipopolysaccharide/colanic/teichoic acid biosynthesis glycosyltransferase